jgi:hypothetical protein
MRLLIASLAAVTAVAFAAPTFAQDPSASPTPTPTTKPKQGTTAYCNTLKSASSKSACLKRVQAPGNSAKTTTKAKAKKPAADPNASAKPPNAAAAPASAPSGNVEVPPLPAKVI